MALSGTEYKENGWVKDSSKAGALSVTTYNAANVATYFISQGLLRDADGRIVVAAAS